MTISDLDTATPAQLAPVLLAALQRLGQLGRSGAVALAAIVEDNDTDFDEAASWVGDVADGGLRD
ncbi:hypothetical protein L6Q21_09700 [Sandaracinobacter sp. RS1-74]|uniref:hypothetical protein n=1 Tax=Sandaracinobacteroides sayramensis TaxID=2913411 RepID=UPI001EDAE5C9|nr:hypothetical protein [Sandaracinobacteroides sayramensis]MCG2841253.1 hypothetical protein [Sandaracinobacteroides sayramensis]